MSNNENGNLYSGYAAIKWMHKIHNEILHSSLTGRHKPHNVCPS